MIKRLWYSLLSNDKPQDKNVIWIDTSNSESFTLKLYRNGGWKPLQVVGTSRDMIERELTGYVTSHYHSYDRIINKPTTLEGYGITDCFNKSEIERLLDDKVTKVDGMSLTSNNFSDKYKKMLDNLSTSYYNKKNVDNLLNEKQDVISDLESIREGSKKGNTALQSFTETDPIYLKDKPFIALKSDLLNDNNLVHKEGDEDIKGSKWFEHIRTNNFGIYQEDNNNHSVYIDYHYDESNYLPILHFSSEEDWLTILDNIADPVDDFHAANKHYVDENLATKANLQHQHTVADITNFPELYYDATAFFTSGAYPSDKYEELLEAVKAKRTVYATIDEAGYTSYVFFVSSANSDGSSSRVLLTTIFADGSYLYLNTFVLQQSGMTPLQESITGKANKATTLAGYGIGDAYTKSEVDTALEGKQDILTAGNGISIEGNVISSSVAEVVDNIVNAGYVFAGVATPATDPSTPNAKVFYIANGKGTYTNFSGLKVTEDDVVVLYYDTAWHKVSTGIASDEKLSELDSKIEDIGIEEYLGDTDEIQFNNDEDTESYAKIGQYGIKAKGFYHMDGTPISQGGSATGYINFNDGDDITSLLETEIAKGGDVHIYGTGIAYIHKPIKISQNHTHIHVGSGATLKLTDSLIDSYTPGNPIWMFYTPGSLYYWNDSRVRTETLEDILIEGGTLDFNGYHKKLMTSGNILAEFVGISIVDVDSFVLRNCTLLGASSFCTMFAGIHGFHIYDCVIHTTGGSHDGLHFHGDICNGIIENLTGETKGDDFVGLNTGGDFWKGWMEEANVVRKGDSFNITIRNIPKGCNVRLLNGKTHSLSGVVLENVPKFSITCYGEDAYYNDITIKGRSGDNTYYVEGSSSISIKGGYSGRSHTIHIKTLIIDSCIIRNSLLMLLANAEIENLMFNNLQYFAEPTPGQISHPDFTGLFPLIKTSNMYLQGDDFNATSVMGQSKVGRLYLNNCFVNDTRTLVNSAGVAYGVKIPAIINTDSIGKIFISNSDITVAKICIPDAQVIKSDSSIINVD